MYPPQLQFEVFKLVSLQNLVFLKSALQPKKPKSMRITDLELNCMIYLNKTRRLKQLLLNFSEYCL